MPLERLTLVNFQVHERLDVKLDPHVTTLVGPTDSGKSSVLRALQWACLNRPRGDEFVRWGCENGTALVKLHADGHVVCRQRVSNAVETEDLGGGNEYRLDGRVFRAFGTGVPATVTDLLAVSDATFQGQLDPPLWFTLSPADVSRELNEVVALDLIDRTLENAGRAVRKAKVAVGVSRERLAAARTSLAGLRWVKEYDRRVRRLERLYEERTELFRKHATLARLISEASQAARRRRNATRGILYAAQAVSAAERWFDLQARFSKLRTLLEKIKESKHLCSKKLPAIARLDNLHKRYADLQIRQRALSTIIEDMTHNRHVVQQADLLIEDARRELGGIKQCPTCGQAIG